MRRRTINQEHLPVVTVLHMSLHSVLQQLHCHFHGHDLAISDVRLDHLAKLAARAFLLLAQQVASRQVLEAIVADEIRALRALSRAGAAENEQHRYVVAGPHRGLAHLDCRHLASSVDVKASLVLCHLGNGLGLVPWVEIPHPCDRRLSS
jgi:hypothetical protein